MNKAYGNEMILKQELASNGIGIVETDLNWTASRVNISWALMPIIDLEQVNEQQVKHVVSSLRTRGAKYVVIKCLLDATYIIIPMELGYAELIAQYVKGGRGRR